MYATVTRAQSIGASSSTAVVPGAPAVYVARPLFADSPVVRGERTDRLLAKLAHDLENRLAILGRQARHDDLAAAVWNPPLRTERADIIIELRRRTLRARAA